MIYAFVPPGSTSGKVTVTANGITGSSASDFTVSIPIYTANVDVTTFANTGGRGLAFDGTGNLYVTPGYADGVADVAQFNRPHGIAIAANGDLYVGDGNNTVIRRVTPDGNVTTLAGSSFGYANGSGSAAQFGYIAGVAIDASGIVYAADVFNYKIRKILIH
jgi:hypothetical protein